MTEETAEVVECAHLFWCCELEENALEIVFFEDIDVKLSWRKEFWLLKGLASAGAES